MDDTDQRLIYVVWFVLWKRQVELLSLGARTKNKEQKRLKNKKKAREQKRLENKQAVGTTLMTAESDEKQANRNQTIQSTLGRSKSVRYPV